MEGSIMNEKLCKGNPATRFTLLIAQERGKCTYFVGASFSSMGELINTAKLWVAALISSWALEMDSLAISSSRTLTLFLFSFVDMLAVAEESVTAGILRKKRKGGRGLWEALSRKKNLRR
jgi:hypothetical protein